MKTDGRAAAHRWVSVSPERLPGWLARFAAAHGALEWAQSGPDLSAVAADGARIDVDVPFDPFAGAADLPADLIAYAMTPRRVGVLLIRRGGYAAGVFDGTELVASKVGSRLVAGRSAAGGWSQQRFARRREGQAREALSDAIETAVRVLIPEAARLDAVVLGGDRRSALAALDDPRLVALRPLLAPRILDVPDPRLRVLLTTPDLFRAVRLRVTDPPPA